MWGFEALKKKKKRIITDKIIGLDITVMLPQIKIMFPSNDLAKLLS